MHRFHSFRITLTFAVLLFMLAGSLKGQPVMETRHQQLLYQVQVAPTVTTLGTGVSGHASVDYNRHVFTLRAASTDPQFGTDLWDVALLYGRSHWMRDWYLSGGAGASIMGGEYNYSNLLGGPNDDRVETMIGFPLEGQISWVPVSFVSLGAHVFANVNTEQPFGGAGVSIRLGKLR